MNSLKAAIANCAGCLEGLISATGTLSLSSHLRRSSLYTLGLMMSQGELHSLYCVRYPHRYFHKMAPSSLKMADRENKMAAAPWFPWDSTMGLAVSFAVKGW